MVDGLIRLMEGENTLAINIRNPGADSFNQGVYDQIVKMKGLPFLEAHVEPYMRNLNAEDVCSGPLITFSGVENVARAAAASGLSLAEVAAEAKHASEMIVTMGVALSVCTLLGQPPSDRLGPGKMELGLGVHGEPGAVVADIQPVDVVVSHVLDQILSRICVATLAWSGTLIAWELVSIILERYHNFSSSMEVPYEQSSLEALERLIQFLLACFTYSGLVVKMGFGVAELHLRVAYVFAFLLFLQRLNTNKISRAKSVQGIDLQRLVTLDMFTSIGLYLGGIYGYVHPYGVPLQVLTAVCGL